MLSGTICAWRQRCAGITGRVEKNARLALHFYARKVHLVLGGTGFVQVLLNGKPLRSVQVTQDRLYTLLDQGHDRDGRLELRFTPGLSAYAFTFG